MKATLSFPSVEMAKDFTSYWACKTLTGHDMSATRSDGSVGVTVYNVDDEKKAIIDAYVSEINR